MTNRALLIGNWEYSAQDQVYRPLSGPQYCVEDMQRALTDEQFGLFKDHVAVKQNLDRSSLAGEIEQFLKTLTPDDYGLIYYAGHGELLGNLHLGLCGIDIDEQHKEARCFSTRDLKDWLEVCRAQATAIILDCCYSGRMMGGTPENDQAISTSFGSGTAVLTSGGTQPVPDASLPGRATRYTSELARILVDEKIPGVAGSLTIERVYDALLAVQPRLEPIPLRSLGGKGSLPLARRDPGDGEDQAHDESAWLNNWTDHKFNAIEVHLGAKRIWANPGGNPVDHDLEKLDRPRQLAIRRIAELVDTIMRQQDYVDRPNSQKLVRSALECIGLNLFETALPIEVQQELMRWQKEPDDDTVLRLRLMFAGEGGSLELLPWEYLQIPRGQGDDSDEMQSRPLGMQQRFMVERASWLSGDTAPGTSVSARKSDGRPGGQGLGQTRTASRAPTGARGSELVGNSAPTARAAVVGVLNTLPSPYAGLGARISNELESLANVSVIFTLGAGSPASWISFVEALRHAPHHLVLMLPVSRQQGSVASFGFPQGAAEPEWRSVGEVARQLKPVDGLQTVTLISVAAEPSRDCFRIVPRAARRLSQELQRPVVFLCHSPGFVYRQDSPDVPVTTFAGLLLQALSKGKELDQSFCHARDRVGVLMSDRDRQAFGVPGCYLPSRRPAELIGQDQPVTGPTDGVIE